MIITPIKTRVLTTPHDDLLEAIRSSKLRVKEGDIIAVTSKVVSIWEGNTVHMDSIDKRDLIKREADYWTPRSGPVNSGFNTIARGILIGSSGIDESNSGRYYTLLPKDPNASARRLLRFFRKEYRVQKIGVVITDSHSIFLRRGALGISVGHAGFASLVDYRGTKDLFGREFQFEIANVADALAAAAVLAIGEGDECTPLAVIRGTDFVFRPRVPRNRATFEVSIEEDKFGILQAVPWRTGGGGKIRE